MKKNKKPSKNTEYRPGAQEVIKNFELEMRMVRDTEKSYFSSEGDRTRKPASTPSYSI